MVKARIAMSRIGDAYRRSGWKVGKGYSSAGLSIRCDIAELEVEDDGEVILFGAGVADVPAHIDRVTEPLRKLGVPWVFEWYDDDGNLLAEWRNDAGA